MNKTKSQFIIVMAAVLIILHAYANAEIVVVDFNSATSSRRCGDPRPGGDFETYEEDGFSLIATSNGGDTTMGSVRINSAFTPTLAAQSNFGFDDQDIVVVDSSGDSFDLLSLEFYEAASYHPVGRVMVEGIREGVVVASQEFVTDGIAGPEEFILSGFKDLDKVRLGGGGSSELVGVDNLTFDVAPHLLIGDRFLRAIEEKQKALEAIDFALVEEVTAIEKLEEILETGEHGNLKKAEIVKAKQKAESAIQHQIQSKHQLEKSIEKLWDSLACLGYEPNPNFDEIVNFYDFAVVAGRYTRRMEEAKSIADDWLAVEPNEPTLYGRLTDGTTFGGSDTIRIIDGRNRSTWRRRRRAQQRWRRPGYDPGAFKPTVQNRRQLRKPQE
jgi:hypothetical protein